MIAMAPVCIVLDLGYLDKFLRRQSTGVAIAEIGAILKRNRTRACCEIVSGAIGDAASIEAAYRLLIAVSQLIDPGRRKGMRPVGANRMSFSRYLNVSAGCDRSWSIGQVAGRQIVLVDSSGRRNGLLSKAANPSVPGPLHH